MNLFYTAVVFAFIQFSLLTVDVETPEIKEITDTDTVELLANIVSIERVEAENFSVKLFKHANEPGSGGQKGTGEISHHYYVLISEYGEYPEVKLFRVGSFYAPNLSILSNNTEIIIAEIKYGSKDDYLKVKLEITESNVSFKD